MKKTGIAIIAVAAIMLMALIYLTTFKVTDIKVTGCEMIEEQLVKDAIQKEKFADNTIILYIRNKIKPIDNIPFVSKIEVEIVSKNEISVIVYEKTIAGCVEYMDGYVYFDKDGFILESSDRLATGVPCIKGLVFDKWEIGEKLPITDESKFNMILAITQLIDKYQLVIDGIKFTPENEIILIHGDITIELGEGEYLPVQMMNLGNILEGLEGMKGTLYMKDFNSEDGTASFSVNKD